MKKIIVSFYALLIVGLSTAFANVGPTPNQLILDVFKKEFSTAQSVSWDKQEEFDKATFLLAGRRVVAWFNPSGFLEGCIRDIFFDQLPLSVMTAVDKRFPDAEILDVREITNAEGTHYRLRLDVTNKRYSIKVGPSGNMEEIEKLAK